MIDPITQTEAVRQRIAHIRELAAQCVCFYPVLQHDECGTHQIAAAATLTGAATIRDMMALRNPDAEFSVGAVSIVMSDALIALKFEPSAIERDMLEQKAGNASILVQKLDHPDPEYIKKMLEEVPKDG